MTVLYLGVNHSFIAIKHSLRVAYHKPKSPVKWDQCSLFQKHLHRRFIDRFPIFIELIGVVWKKLHQASSLSVDANQSFVILNGGAIEKEYQAILCVMLAPFMFHHCTSVGYLGFKKYRPFC